MGGGRDRNVHDLALESIRIQLCDEASTNLSRVIKLHCWSFVARGWQCDIARRCAFISTRKWWFQLVNYRKKCWLSVPLHRCYSECTSAGNGWIFSDHSFRQLQLTVREMNVLSNIQHPFFLEILKSNVIMGSDEKPRLIYSKESQEHPKARGGIPRLFPRWFVF